MFKPRSALSRRALGCALAALAAALVLAVLPAGASSAAVSQPALVGGDLSGDPIAGSRSVSSDSGRVRRVLVTATSSLIPEGRLEPSTRRAQRAGVASATQSLIELIGGEGTEVLRRYRTITAVALEVSEPAALKRLDELDSSPAWSVADDHALEPASYEKSVDSIGAPQVWEAGFTGEGGTIAVVDTAVDADASWLTDGQGGSRVVAEACFAAACPNGESEMHGAGSAAPVEAGPWWYHGTYVAGIAAGDGNEGFVGVAPGADLVGIRLGAPTQDCPDPEPCGTFSVSDALAAFDWLAANHDDLGLEAVNFSAGWDAHGEPCYDSPFRAAVQHLTSDGVAVVAATGNDGYKSYVNEPACVPEVVGVGATTGFDVDALEPADYSNLAPFVDFVAPTGAGTGTSAAAPYVTGALALLQLAAPEFSTPEVVSALSASGLPVLDATSGVSLPYPQLFAAYAYLLRPDGGCSPQPGSALDCPDAQPGQSDDPMICDNEPVVIVVEPGEAAVGTNCDDLIVGTDGDDLVDGRGGDDVIFGMGGRDTIEAGAGADTVYGGAGIDTLSGGAGWDRIYGEHNPDFIDGGEGRDWLYGDGGDDQITGGGDDDFLFGGQQHDHIDGQDGRDQLWGGLGDDTLLGGSTAERDQILGGSGHDYIAGGPGDDHLAGNLGADTVHAGPGSDTVNLVDDLHGLFIGLLWGKDYDHATGGAGYDTIWMHSADQVEEFETAHVYG